MRTSLHAGLRPHARRLLGGWPVHAAYAAGDAPTGRLDPALEPLLAAARSDALRAEFLKAPAASYSTEHGVSMLVATYNLNGAPTTLWTSSAERGRLGSSMQLQGTGRQGRRTMDSTGGRGLMEAGCVLELGAGRSGLETLPRT